KAKPPKSNITKEERTAIKRLRQNPNITVLPVDKGNATVLLRSESYHQKIRKILEDPIYCVLPRDPTDLIMRKTSALLRGSGLPTETCKNLLPQGPVPPRLYGLPKIHKEGTPLRPIYPPCEKLGRIRKDSLPTSTGSRRHHGKLRCRFTLHQSSHRRFTPIITTTL
ncbi:hypothetical protein J437_LFUL004929, partial [Ladona fulva]